MSLQILLALRHLRKAIWLPQCIVELLTNSPHHTDCMLPYPSLLEVLTLHVSSATIELGHVGATCHHDMVG